jgi:putative addiction module component (TIGR02574 family)
MSERSAALLAEALKLPEEERAAMADELYASLEGEPDINAMTDEEFAQELERRHQEYLRDPSVGVPLEEVKRLTRIK